MDDLPLVAADRVQLQQVILNLVVNALEALSTTNQGPRELLIRTDKFQSDGVLVAVRDSGPGLDASTLERMFESFYTTKPTGLGDGSLNLPFHHRGAWRQALGEHERRAWRCYFPIYPSRRCNRFFVSRIAATHSAEARQSDVRRAAPARGRPRRPPVGISQFIDNAYVITPSLASANALS